VFCELTSYGRTVKVLALVAVPPGVVISPASGFNGRLMLAEWELRVLRNGISASYHGIAAP